jgi:multiple sugar transport system permease protein
MWRCFSFFVVYPFGYALWMAGKPSLYAELIADPSYLPTVVNTLLFVGLGVNIKMFLALLLSGFFLRPRWWIRALLAVFILPWAIAAAQSCVSFHWMLQEGGLVNGVLSALFGINGPIWFNDRWLALGSNIVVYIWKWMPFWTIIFPAARKIPRDIYNSAKVDGATGTRCFVHVTFPLLANLYLLGTLLSTLDSWQIHDRLSRLGRGAGGSDARAGDARIPLRLRYRQAGARHRGGAVGPPGADPDCDRIDAQAPDERGGAMSVALALPQRARRRYRLRRVLPEAGSVMLGIIILIWSLTPV